MRLSLALLLLAATARADDAPVIHIRSRARLEVGTVERAAGGVQVAGALWDDAAAQGVPGRAVRVALRSAAGTLAGEARTDERGGFQLLLPAPPSALGQYQLEATFAGDSDYAAPSPIARPVDVARRAVALAIAAPERAGVGAAAIPVTVEVRDRGLPADLPIEVALPGAAARTVASGAEGRVELVVQLPEQAQPGARLLLSARFAGDEQRDAAQAEQALLVTTPTRIRAALARATVRRGEPLEVSGELAWARGALASEPVEIVAADGSALGAALTDGAGRFRAELSTRGRELGPLVLVARYRPSASFRDPADAPPLAATLLAPAPIPLGALAAPFAATALALAAAWSARKKPWRRFARRAVAPADAPPEPARRAPTVGLVTARPSLRQALRRPDDFGVDGVAWDAHAGRAVAAQLRVVGPGSAHTVQCDRRGRFAVEGLPAGRHEFNLFAPGYLPLRFSRELPHRGELRGVRVQLQPVRVEVLAVYRQIAVGWLPEAKLIDTWTPRELCEHARRLGPPPPALGALTDLVEECYYSPRLSDESTLAEAVRLAAQLDPPLPA